MANVRAILGVARGPFLLLSVTLVAAGAAAAAYDGTFSWVSTLLALVGLVALHASVDAFNEASDMRTGIDLHTERTPFSGGSGTLPSGAMSQTGALVVAIVGALIGLAVGIWFVVHVGRAMIPIVIAGAVMVLAYAEVLSRTGLGELAAGLGLGALPIIGTAAVQRGAIGPAAWIVAIPAFCMTFNLLLLNEFPDERADRQGGRRNLVLLLGRRGAGIVYVAAVAVVPVAIVAGVAAGALPAIALLGILPLKFVIAAVQWALRQPEQPVPIPTLAGNVIWNLSTNVALAVALGVATWLKL